MIPALRRALLALLLAGVAWSSASNASADLESCTEAHAAGQRHENLGHLGEALGAFQTCASDADCPLPIRNECTQLYTTVEGRLPSVVISVADGEGNDLVDVRVFSGGTLIADGLDGRPVSIDPGLHEFRFELPMGKELTKSVVVRQGEKDRLVSVRAPHTVAMTAAPTAPRARQELPTVDQTQPEPAFHMPLGAWVSYGVGVAALGSWGTFALLGRNKEKSLVECSPSCPSDMRGDYDDMKRDYLISDISLGIAGAAAVAGTIVLLTMGRRPEKTDRVAVSGPALSVSPVALGRTGGLLMLRGRY